jgi:hypothetical protein
MPQSRNTQIIGFIIIMVGIFVALYAFGVLD